MIKFGDALKVDFHLSAEGWTVTPRAEPTNGAQPEERHLVAV